MLKLDKDHIDLTPENNFTDIINIISDEDWYIDAQQKGKKLIFDCNSNCIVNDFVIELGDVDADSIHIASLWQLNLYGTVKLLSNNLKFFKVNDVDDIQSIELLDDRTYQFFTNTINIPIVFDSTNLSGEVTSMLEINFSLIETWTITIHANVISVDERLKVMMSNFNRDWLSIYGEAMLQADNRQSTISACLQNDKMREWLIRRDDFESKLGTYAGLLNILDWLGYTNAVTIYEILKNLQGMQNDMTSKLYINLGESIEKYVASWFRTNLLALVYNYNYATGKYCSKCKAMPILENQDTLPNQDTLRKLQNLIKVLENEFLPEHIHFEDLEIDIYSVYIATLLSCTQQTEILNVYPQVPGIKYIVKDSTELVNVNIDDDITNDSNEITAWIRPQTFYIDHELDMTSLFGDPNSVFVALETNIDANEIIDKEYIDWWLQFYNDYQPAYLYLSKQSINIDNPDSASTIVTISSNRQWQVKIANTLAMTMFSYAKAIRRQTSMLRQSKTFILE